MKAEKKVLGFVFGLLLLLQSVSGSSRVEGGVMMLSSSILVGSVTGLVCALVCACLVRLVLTCMRRPPLLKGPVVFSPQVSPKSLHSALQNPLHHIHIGGNYHKTLLDNGFPIALKTHTRKRRRRIQRELQVVAGLSHRHLMSLRAYYALADTLCLVYDYVPTGSLEDAMRNQQLQQIGWDARLRIAVGIIKALHYLHFTCTPPILHYNLKPSNVLLDPDFEPRLTDYVHTFAADADDNNTNRASQQAQGCCCYYAPEHCSIYTEKSDIFSFGVILGMLLTGRDPNDPLFLQQVTNGSRGGMGMWLRQLVEAGDACEALDKRLLGEDTQEDEMLMAVRIAAVCLSDMPADRPSSDELVPMLTQLHSF